MVGRIYSGMVVGMKMGERFLVRMLLSFSRGSQVRMLEKHYSDG